jgi:hypothetical protein
MKTKIVFTRMLGLALLAMAAPHVWTFKQGGTIAGDYYTSGTAAVVIRRDGTNCILPIANLSSNDLAYVAKIKADQKQARLDAEVKQMRQAGMIELTAKLIQNFPEKVLPYQKGWMDVTFNSLSQVGVDIPEMQVGLCVIDRNGDSFWGATIFKQLNEPDPNTKPVLNPLASWVLNLKDGDTIRLIGHCYPKFSDNIHELAGTPDKAGFLVERIEIIETAAEKKAREQATEQTLPALDPHTGLPLIQK